MIKINWALDDYDLIRDIIRIIRHYNKRVDINSKEFCHNSFRRFKIEKYIDELKKDLNLQWQTIRFLKKHKKEVKND
jgi:hypothetical protein